MGEVMEKANKEPRPRKLVTDQEFRLAFYGNKEDPESLRRAEDNRAVVKSVLKRFAKSLPKQILDELEFTIMWRTLEYHREEFGKKFTSNLVTFAEWECRRAYKKHHRKLHPNEPIVAQPADREDIGYASSVSRAENLDHLRECVDMIPDKAQQKVIKQYYFEGKTLKQIGNENGYSKETARTKVGKALAELKRICHDSLNGD